LVVEMGAEVREHRLAGEEEKKRRRMIIRKIEALKESKRGREEDDEENDEKDENRMEKNYEHAKESRIKGRTKTKLAVPGYFIMWLYV